MEFKGKVGCVILIPCKTPDLAEAANIIQAVGKKQHRLEFNFLKKAPRQTVLFNGNAALGFYPKQFSVVPDGYSAYAGVKSFLQTSNIA